jgi:hypothetical protein
LISKVAAHTRCLESFFEDQLANNLTLTLFVGFELRGNVGGAAGAGVCTVDGFIMAPFWCPMRSRAGA